MNTYLTYQSKQNQPKQIKMSYSKTLQLVNPSIESCINTFPVELKREILSYLHIGIIVSLFEQKKRVVLYCMKMERMDRNKSFTSVFQDCSVKELIDIIMITETINKKYIMRHFIDFFDSDTGKFPVYGSQVNILKVSNLFCKMFF